MIYVEHNGKISRLTAGSPLTLTHSPLKIWDMPSYSPDMLESLVNSGTAYELLIDCLPLVGGEDIVKVALIWDEKVQGSDGGTFTAGAWRQRVLNASLDPDGLITLATNQVSIVASGKYLIRAQCPTYYTLRNQARLMKNNALLKQGTSEFAGQATTHYSYVAWVGDLLAGDVLKLEHQCSSTVATNGFGVGDASNYGVEIFSLMEVYQL